MIVLAFLVHDLITFAISPKTNVLKHGADLFLIHACIYILFIVFLMYVLSQLIFQFSINIIIILYCL